jgi:glycosyltransferase involved in cell wall biosynthesis
VRLHINAVGMVTGGGLTHLEKFVPALMNVRPEWEVLLHVSRYFQCGVRDVQTHEVRRASWRRLVWDSFTVGRQAGAAKADVLLNLANYGPLRPPIPSVLYQANSLYFDREWVRGMSRAQRYRAFIRRELAFAQIRGSAAVVVPTEAMSSYLRAWNGYPSNVPMQVVSHGIDIDRFPFLSKRTPDRTRIVAVGNAMPYKDHALLIQMMEELRRRRIDAHLELAGFENSTRGPAAAIQDQIRRSGLEGRIHIVGCVDSPSFLKGADVMVLPSVTESFGFPILEAMASGIPIVASSIPSTKEILGELGWYFPVGDANSAADRVVAVLTGNESEMRGRLLSGREVASRYSWEKNAQSVAELLESVARKV